MLFALASCAFLLPQPMSIGGSFRRATVPIMAIGADDLAVQAQAMFDSFGSAVPIATQKSAAAVQVQAQNSAAAAQAQATQVAAQAAQLPMQVQSFIEQAQSVANEAGPVTITGGGVAFVLAARAIAGAFEAVKPLIIPSLFAVGFLAEAYLATEISSAIPILGDPLQVFTNLVGVTVVAVGGGFVYVKANNLVKTAADKASKLVGDKTAEVQAKVKELPLPAPETSPLQGLQLELENPFRTPDERSYVNIKRREREEEEKRLAEEDAKGKKRGWFGFK